MRAKRRAIGMIALMIYLGLPIAAAVAVSPDTYHDMGGKGLSKTISAISAPSYSIDTYHDM
jgi:hypothetical protein